MIARPGSTWWFSRRAANVAHDHKLSSPLQQVWWSHCCKSYILFSLVLSGSRCIWTSIFFYFSAGNIFCHLCPCHFCSRFLKLISRAEKSNQMTDEQLKRRTMFPLLILMGSKKVLNKRWNCICCGKGIAIWNIFGAPCPRYITGLTMGTYLNWAAAEKVRQKPTKRLFLGVT